MKRVLIAALVALMLVSVAGCKERVEIDSPEAGGGSDTPVAAQDLPAAAQAMTTDGPGETAALSALPKAVEQAEKLSSLVWPDITGIEPAFTAYLVAVDMGGQTALLEVRADGVAHGLYAYQKAFDSGTLVWTPTDQMLSGRAAAQSEPERQAIASAEAAMRDSFPDAAFTTSIYGYRFEYDKDAVRLIAVEVATDGSLISAGN
jgi:hypothetical protein